MAATIAQATGYDRVRAKDVHRLGSEAAKVQAATWHTFATAYVSKDGSGYVEVKQNGETLGSIKFGPEDQPFAVNIEGRPRL